MSDNLLDRIYNYMFSPSSSAGCTAVPSDVCLGGHAPRYGDGVSSVPATVNESALAGGVEVTWKPRAANCDSSTDGVRLVCHFSYRDGTTEDLEVLPVNGEFTVRKTLTKEFDKVPTCDLYYTNPNMSDETPEPIMNAISLYGPTIVYDTVPADVCDPRYTLPVINGLIQSTPDCSEIYPGEAATVYFPMASALECDGETTGADPDSHLVGEFYLDSVSVEENRLPSQVDLATNSYYAYVAFEDYGQHLIYLKVTDTSRGTSAISRPLECWVKDPSPMPEVTMSHNPATGPGSGYNIDFDATGSYSPAGLDITNYSLAYGDGENDSNSTGIFHHAYPNPGPGGLANYSAQLTITDSNGQSSSIYIAVSLWGD